MQLIRRNKNENYSTISNVVLRDSNLSLKAKGFIATVFSLPEDWDFSVNGMSKILKEKKSAIYSTINELKDAGYCEVTQERMEDGRFSDNIYNFYEKPFIYKENLPLTDFRDTDNPDSENQPQYNKDLIKDLNKEYTTMLKQDFDDEKSHEVTPRKKSSSEQVQLFVDLYRRHCKMLPDIIKVTTARSNKVVTRLGEMGGLEMAEEVLKKIARNRFLTGQVTTKDFNTGQNRTWKADFDWIIANDTNWVKVIEGKYDKYEDDEIKFNTPNKEEKILFDEF